MRRIEVDDEVYDELSSHAVGFDTPNDVVRRLILSPDAVPMSARPDGAKGALADLMAAGLIAAGDGLVHTQTRKGRTFEATVDSDGCIVTTLGTYRKPSPALKDLVGTQIDGWANWMHRPSGKRLRDLGIDLRARP